MRIMGRLLRPPRRAATARRSLSGGDRRDPSDAETSTSPALPQSRMRAARRTAAPEASAPRNPTSPLCNPARRSGPIALARSTMWRAQMTARPVETGERAVAARLIGDIEFAALAISSARRHRRPSGRDQSRRGTENGVTRALPTAGSILRRAVGGSGKAADRTVFPGLDRRIDGVAPPNERDDATCREMTYPGERG